MDLTQEINSKNALIWIEKYKLTPMCVWSTMHQNINVECKEDRYFGDEVKTLYNKEKNHWRAAKPKKSTNRKNI